MVRFEERERGEGYLAARFDNGQISDQRLLALGYTGWR